MRKFLICTLAALVAVLAISSCEDNREGTYRFGRIHYSQVQSPAALSEIQAYINGLPDPYLKNGSTNEASGRYIDVANAEIKKFLEKCDELDGEFISSKLTGIDDYYAISLLCMDPGGRLITVKWNPANDTFIQE